MRPTKIMSVITYAVLGLAVAAGFLLPGSLSIQSVRALTPPAEIELTGLIRDFSETHADMEPGCAGCTGHFTGNVMTVIGPDKRPIYAGVGTRVDTEWTDSSGRPIAPHLFNSYGTIGNCYRIPGVAADGPITITNSSVVDSFDSTLGAYGGANIGADGLLSTNSIAPQSFVNKNSAVINGDILGGPGGDMGVIYYTGPASVLNGTMGLLDAAIPIPVVSEPGGLGPSTGPVTYGAGTTQITGDLHADSMTLNAGAILEIVGHNTILVEGDVTMVDDSSQILIMPDSSLRLFMKGNGQIKAHINQNTGDPTLCTIYKLGSGLIECEGNQALVAARFYMPDSMLSVRQSSEVFGTFVGKHFDLDNNSRFHVDVAYSGQPDFPDDTAGTFGAGASGASEFDEWFRDFPGVNLSRSHSITLVRNLAGVYEYLDDTFHPIDNSLFGNEGNSHNSHLTYTINAEFDHPGCGDYFIEFEGGDGAWVFINGRLAIELGGMASGTPQHVQLDRFDLVPGETYRVRIFYAQRRTASETFRLRTNIELRTAGVPAMSAQFD